MARVVEIPVVGHDTIVVGEATVQRRAGVRRHDVEGRCLQAARDAPIDGPFEHIGSVIVEAEHEATVDHHAEIVAASDRFVVVAAEVLALGVLAQVLGVEGLEADEHAAHARGGCSLDQVTAKDRLHRARSLEEASHAAHALEQPSGETFVAEQMVVEEVQVPAGEAVDLRESPVDRLRVERAAALVEGILVAEVAVVRAAARHDDRIGAQVASTFDQVAAHGWDPCKPPHARGGLVPRLGPPSAEVSQELLPCALTGTDEDRIGMQRCLVGERRGMQPTDTNICPACAVRVRDLPGASR